MSGAAAGAHRIRSNSAKALPAAGLRVVQAARPGTKPSSGAFVVLLAGLLAVGLLGLLGLNMALAQGSFASTDLSRQQAALADTEQQLQQQVAELQSPQHLAASALALGMVGTTNPVFIDPLTGKVLGVPLVARRPHVAATTTPSAVPSPAGSAARLGPSPAASGPAAKPSAGATKPSAGATKPTASPHPSPSAGAHAAGR
jgi:hypothetical protein